MDLAKAHMWYSRAAAQGDIDVCVNLGTMYQQGLGVPQDYMMARQIWEVAATRGKKATAMYGIGVLYLNGQGVEKDLDEAMRWFNKAKAHGQDVGPGM